MMYIVLLSCSCLYYYYTSNDVRLAQNTWGEYQTVQPSLYCRDSTDPCVPNPAYALVETTNVLRSRARVYMQHDISMAAIIELLERGHVS